MKFKFKIKNQKGIALVEVVAALGVAAIAITALVSLSISTLRTSLDSKLLLEGSKIANREIELVRAYRDAEDRSWVDFINAVRNCINDPDDPSHVESCSINISNGNVINAPSTQGTGVEMLTRRFWVTDMDGNSIPSSDYPGIVRISVSVTWQIGDNTKSANIYTDLSNWRGR